ncbi:hypothetical protein [Amycolatopsis keratiniphila]|uniref:Lipoprotein n=1 Tax=Amycolatopsis keratiniphila TaxID=129921 RepID=R4T2C1_9PSEU|nr:hypothetical protein [Amycolatopsis keratiniphila]AGM08955.1 hypothetical protein AORI_6372 [Amycolatopsis keratiniphila]
MRRWLVLGLLVAAGACTTSPPSQVPVPAITSTPVTTVTATPPKPTRTTTSVKLEYQKCLRDPEKIWDTGTQKCRYKTSGEVQWEHLYGPLPPETP